MSAVHRRTEEVAAVFRREGVLPWGDHDPGLFNGVCIFNALHEMGDPVAVCRSVREKLEEGGSLMLVEPVAGDTLADNRGAVGRSFLAASTMVCLPSALSQGGVWHLGAQAPDREFARGGGCRVRAVRACRRDAAAPGIGVDGLTNPTGTDLAALSSHAAPVACQQRR